MRDEYFRIDMPPVIGKTFENMTTKEAISFYEWHMKFLDARIHNMCTELRFDGNFEPESLIELWELVIEEFKHINSKKTLLDMLFNKSKEDGHFQTIVSCAGLYLAETFRKNNPSLYWTCLLKGPSNLLGKNMPVLMGFVDYSFDPPFHTYFEPQHMIEVQASSIIYYHDATNDQLYNLYLKWCEKYINK